MGEFGFLVSFASVTAVLQFGCDPETLENAQFESEKVSRTFRPGPATEHENKVTYACKQMSEEEAKAFLDALAPVKSPAERKRLAERMIRASKYYKAWTPPVSGR